MNIILAVATSAVLTLGGQGLTIDSARPAPAPVEIVGVPVDPVTPTIETVADAGGGSGQFVAQERWDSKKLTGEYKSVECGQATGCVDIRGTELWIMLHSLFPSIYPL